jgi:hypothetical protein
VGLVALALLAEEDRDLALIACVTHANSCAVRRDMLCIDYYEACQRKNGANSWNDCHSRVEVSRQQAQKKICWDSVHVRLE